jgi:hypothetical protein
VEPPTQGGGSSRKRVDRPTGDFRVTGQPAGRKILRRLACVPMMQASDHGHPALVGVLTGLDSGVSLSRERCVRALW